MPLWSACSSRRVRLAVRLTPRGGRDAIDGWATGADGRPYLKVRVSAPPVEGEANAALTVLLAKTFGLSLSFGAEPTVRPLGPAIAAANFQVVNAAVAGYVRTRSKLSLNRAAHRHRKV